MRAMSALSRLIVARRALFPSGDEPDLAELAV
jgi:hypothetical protein